MDRRTFCISSAVGALGVVAACVRAKNQPRVSRTVAAQERDESAAADVNLVSWVIAA